MVRSAVAFCKDKKPIAWGNLQPVHHKTANLKGYDLKIGAVISLLHAEYFLCENHCNNRRLIHEFGLKLIEGYIML